MVIGRSNAEQMRLTPVFIAAADPRLATARRTARVRTFSTSSRAASPPPRRLRAAACGGRPRRPTGRAGALPGEVLTVDWDTKAPWHAPPVGRAQCCQCGPRPVARYRQEPAPPSAGLANANGSVSKVSARLRLGHFRLVAEAVQRVLCAGCGDEVALALVEDDGVSESRGRLVAAAGACQHSGELGERVAALG